jgi:hypothetical protein
MKITMLGMTGTGKTCYMLGMYSFMSIGLRGFTLTATDLDVDLDLTDKWDTLMYGQSEDRWPPANDSNIYKYSFDFNYAAKPIMNFNWIDYRGGALRDKSTETDVQSLMEYVKDSDCLFLCISGQYLKEGIVHDNGEINYSIRNKVAGQLRVQAMNKIITDIQKKLNPTNAKPFPVAVVITKYDLCAERGKEAISRDIRQLMEPLFQPNSGWLTMICPVSLGKEVATNPNNGAIEPINVHLPVVFAIYAKLREIALEIQNHQDTIRGDLDKKKNLWKRLFGDKEGDDRDKRWRELEGQFQEIQSNMALLSQELQKVSLFRGNQEVGADVSV